MIVKTAETEYELDLHARVLRRNGGEWEAYDHLTPRTPEVGVAVAIDYGKGRQVMTSLIVEVEK